METVAVAVVVEASGIEYAFSFLAHHTSRVEDRFLEAAFYEEHSPTGVPRGEHYEMEIVQPEVWKHEHAKHVHFHTNPAGRHFVCWVNQVPNLESAKLVLKFWCIGTTLTLATGQDFVPVLQQDPKSFISRMESQGITLKSMMTA